MKLAAIVHRTLVTALLAATVALAGACPGGGANQGVKSGFVPDPQPGGDPLLTADGKHFAASRFYKGECMPAGSRGGCYSITLEPDGTYSHMLLDAAMRGTYVIEGDQVNLIPDGDAQRQTLTLSADRTKLGDFTYEPAAAP